MKDKTGCLEASTSHETGEPSVCRNRVLNRCGRGNFLHGNRFRNISMPRSFFELVSFNSFILSRENSKRY